ncbi:MAG: carbohydrate-binding protein [Bacteroidales bacterium]|nr:carbohydrate-binding protein [Bacteroidales bacterium]
MKQIFLLAFLIIFVADSFSQSKSYKRGVAYGYHSTADMQNASQNISWWYNWATQPDLTIRSTYHNFEVDFTPMAWNASGISGVGSWVNIDSNVKYILGFNEPNFKDQANMTPSAAATAWPALQAIADEHSLTLVGPAVNYCGTCVSEGAVTYTNPFQYLDDFFKACTDCRVDHIALHWYGGGGSITSYIEDARKYNKPIWVTEFAAWDGTVSKVEDQLKYLAGTVNFLERDPDVYRYSWFIGRTSGGAGTYPYIDLYSTTGMLTPLGQLYMDIPVYDPEMHFNVPGRIQTEEYYLMKGLFTEPTSDNDGFLNMGWTDLNDWAEYKIHVGSAGTYDIYGRVAGTGVGMIDFLVDGVKAATLNTPNTGGWQIWQTVSTTIDLPEGDHILKMVVKDAGFNINWIEITNDPVGLSDYKMFEAEIFPNPIKDGIVNIKMDLQQYSGGDFLCCLYDPTGRKVYDKNIHISHSNFQLNLNNSGNLKAGVYFLKIYGETGEANCKLIVE